MEGISTASFINGVLTNTMNKLTRNKKYNEHVLINKFTNKIKLYTILCVYFFKNLSFLPISSVSLSHILCVTLDTSVMID